MFIGGLLWFVENIFIDWISKLFVKLIDEFDIGGSKNCNIYIDMF